MKSSNWTGRTARTLNEALGPYTSNHITEAPHKLDWHDKIVLYASLASALALLALVLCGIIK